MPDIQRLGCRHIFHDGHSCGSPALRNEEFCYFHHNSRKPRKTRPLGAPGDPFELPIPEDRSAIQASIAIIVQRVAAGSIDARRASILLRALKLAQQTLTFIGPPKSLKPVTEIPASEVETKENQPAEEQSVILNDVSLSPLQPDAPSSRGLIAQGGVSFAEANDRLPLSAATPCADPYPDPSQLLRLCLTR